MFKSHHPRFFRGLVAGAAAGVIAACVMNQFLAIWSKAQEALKDPTQTEPASEAEDSTEKVADAIAFATTGRHLSKEAKKKAGPMVHYAFGSLMGGAYGALAEYSPQSRRGFGTIFGAVLFLGADEIVVPALGLGKSPCEDTFSNQASHLAAHLVYGAAVEAGRRGLRRLW
jgi:uncharacterized membrane protein YagU involved in acid resistance